MSNANGMVFALNNALQEKCLIATESCYGIKICNYYTMEYATECFVVAILLRKWLWNCIP